MVVVAGAAVADGAGEVSLHVVLVARRQLGVVRRIRLPRQRVVLPWISKLIK